MKSKVKILVLFLGTCLLWGLFDKLPAYGDLTESQCAKVAKTVASLLQQAHFSQKPADEKLSQVFLKDYLDALDFSHMVFLQSDIDEFNEKYGKKLFDYIYQEDLTPAFDIYSRYIHRLTERESLIEGLLATPHDFTKDEYYQTDRSKMPWPKTEEEAKDLWRKRIKFELLQGKLANEKPEQTKKTISRRYARLLKEMREADSEEILDYYLNALTHAYDPHSDYQSPSEAKNFEINSIKLSLTGIGAVLKSEEGYPKIVSLVPGGPADLDKRLKPNDRIVAVQQEKGEPVDVVDMKLNKVVEMIRGEKGTKVTLIVIPADSPDDSVRKSVTLVRDEVKLNEQRAKAFVYEKTEKDGKMERLGVIQLPGFYEHASDDVALLIKRLEKEKISGLVLDLRKNGGGMLEEAVNMTALFIKDGPVVQVKDFRGRVQPFLISSNRYCYGGPLVVLISRFSASASEIVAAALQDYGRAIIVGDQVSHGKGTVQTLISLSDFMPWDFHGDPGRLKVTVQKFYRITGLTTQQHGVASDIVFPSLDDYLEIGESSLPNYLPADQINPMNFQKVNTGLSTIVPVLQRRSAQRIASSIDFIHLNSEIEVLKKKMSEKLVSLNEAQRKKEKEEFALLKKNYETARAEQKSSYDKIYEFDIESVKNHKEPKIITNTVEKTSPTTDNSLEDTKILDEKFDDSLNSSPKNDFVMLETLNVLKDYIFALQEPKNILVLKNENS
ncbi:peptidase S41 [Methylacidiphilum kamchatkense Kam1]|uniref:Carboxyl-terminal processing protease n=1 Tax=Methylacidiphilum kamchatkense Kam1 TaxID=1202785 RepID=A0A0C1RW13_9BACT|nr:carboxy terminal-processing peptidase [Methylacidiphilum kamchatkense]KIE59116.1 peptidase S41 [Methylacidiphilum kamchatkense Kam1]QDQ42965.1 carboxyl-terminal processing protease [Methylacidiphilum kamchatkense Kam1]